MNYTDMSVIQLKNICKNKKLKGYSRLNKYDLIKLLEKKIKIGPVFLNYKKNKSNIRLTYHIYI